MAPDAVRIPMRIAPPGELLTHSVSGRPSPSTSMVRRWAAWAGIAAEVGAQPPAVPLAAGGLPGVLLVALVGAADVGLDGVAAEGVALGPTEPVPTGSVADGGGRAGDPVPVGEVALVVVAVGDRAPPLLVPQAASTSVPAIAAALNPEARCDVTGRSLLDDGVGARAPAAGAASRRAAARRGGAVLVPMPRQGIRFADRLLPPYLS